MTTIYLIRHSEPLKDIDIYNTDEDIFAINKNNPLSINGEEMSKKFSNNKEFKNIDVIWSSNYTRAISTAKYFANNNNLKINVSKEFGERKQGIKSWHELPKDFEQHQFLDENYKIGNGESQKETRIRITKAINELLDRYKGKRIIVIGHATATTYLLKNWCNINYNGNYYFNNKIFFNGKWDYLETFKLVFDENNNLVDIENIEHKIEIH